MLLLRLKPYPDTNLFENLPLANCLRQTWRPAEL